MNEGEWHRPNGASGLHWFDTRAGFLKSACGRYHAQLDYKADRPGLRKCWECSSNRCPTKECPLGTCPGDHGK